MIRSIPRPLLLAMLLIGARGSVGQVTIQSASINGELLTPTTLYHLVVINTGAPAMVRLDGFVRTRQGEQVVAFRTAEQLLPSGTSTWTASSSTMQAFNYGAGEAGRTARVHQRLPGGQFTWCIRINSDAAETGDEWCDDLVMEDLLYLDLVMPWHKDTIDEVRPALTWTITGSPTAVAAAKVRITLVPMSAPMNAAQALAAEVPLFNVNDVTQRTLLYPPGAPDLQRGRCYAWQAERVVDGRVADRSEPWSFCVRDLPKPQADKYVLLDRIEPGSVYQAVDDRIYFRYDEPYASTDLRCVVLGPGRRELVPDARNESAGPGTTLSKQAGVNLYELDLSPYALKTGIYTLRVLDGKGRHYELQFNVPR